MELMEYSIDLLTIGCRRLGPGQGWLNDELDSAGATGLKSLSLSLSLSFSCVIVQCMHVSGAGRAVSRFGTSEVSRLRNRSLRGQHFVSALKKRGLH